METNNENIEKIKLLTEQNTSLTLQLKDLQELDRKKSIELIALKDEMLKQQSLFESKINEHQKSIEQCQHKQKVEHELQINELMAKVSYCFLHSYLGHICQILWHCLIIIKFSCLPSC